ncbi:MAG: CAP domain-containing protein [Patescibacteria group bacterium]
MKIKELFKKRRIVYSATVLAVFFACFNFAFASEITRENIVNLVNQSRTENGLPALSENEKLDKAAQDKANDMIANNYFAHTSPSGITPWFWIEKNGYDYQYAGENLALGFSTVENEHQAWMNSPTHKKNILNTNYEEIGVAVGKGVIENNTVTVAVQTFGTQAGSLKEEKKENNIPDIKPKNDGNGIVLNLDGSKNSGSGNSSDLFKGNEFKLKANWSSVKEFLSNPWIASMVIVLAFCLIINIFVLMIIFLHHANNRLRKNQEAFKMVNTIIILLIIASITF